MCGDHFLPNGIIQGQLDILAAENDVLRAAVQKILVSGMSVGTEYGAFTSCDGETHKFVQTGCCPSNFDEALQDFNADWADTDQ